MLYAPITRSYTETYAEKPNMDAIVPYERNNIRKPKGMSECLAYLHDWKNKMWTGDCFCYEYHFVDIQSKDITNLAMSKLLYDDIRALKSQGLQGIIEDGSQRSFFPTGFQFYVYGETLFDSSVSFDELKEDYFSHAFGENWKAALGYLEELKGLMRYTYFSGKESKDESKGRFYNPEMVEAAQKARELINAFAPVIKDNLVQPQRASSVAWQLLELSCIYAEKMSFFVEHLAVGDTENAAEALKVLNAEMSKHEVYFERYYDHFIFMREARNYLNLPNIFDNMNL